MRISDWSSDVCSSDLHGMRNTRHIGAIVKRCLGIGQGAMKSQTILLCKTPLSFAHLQDFGYQAITNMRRAGRYIRGMVFEHDHRLGLMQLQGDRKSVVEGKSGSVRVDLGGSRIITKNKKITRVSQKYTKINKNIK